MVLDRRKSRRRFRRGTTAVPGDAAKGLGAESLQRLRESAVMMSKVNCLFHAMRSYAGEQLLIWLWAMMGNTS